MTRAETRQAELPLAPHPVRAGRIAVDGDAPAIALLDWDDIATQLDAEGYALLPGWLAPQQARSLGRLAADAAPADAGDLYRLPAALPEPLAAWREALYRHLVPIANRWSERLGAASRYPDELADFLHRCHQARQTRPLSRFSLLREDGYVALHQQHDGEHVFPLQCVALLSEPGRDFTGGEFVMTEQRPRMQSRPMVLPLRLGDAALIATAHRPARGAGGDYRVNLKHAISRVRGGTRIGLDLSFHDAP